MRTPVQTLIVKTILKFQWLIASLLAAVGTLVFLSYAFLIQMFGLTQRWQLWRLRRRSESLRQVVISTSHLRSKEKSYSPVQVLHREVLAFEGKLRGFQIERPRLIAIGFVCHQIILRNVKRRKAVVDSLTRVLAKVDPETLYCELALWVLLPAAFAEEALGDLEEQFALHRYAHGAESAMSWYRRQVRLELANQVWRKLERLAAICGILEVLHKILKNNIAVMFGSTDIPMP